MRNTKYQLIFLGSDHSLKSNIQKLFIDRIKELGLNESNISSLNRNGFGQNYYPTYPTVAIFFGDTDNKNSDSDILDKLISNSTFIIPVINDLNNATNILPEKLLSVNAFELKNKTDIEALIGSLLEGLSLLRLSRRLFISYKRSESSGVAIQIYERLEHAGFDVFLDTHSVRPGDEFQEELWHRLADTDVVVLLDTKNFLKSEWTTQEVAKANSMAIGILQLIWPDHTPDPMSKFSDQIQLNKDSYIQKNFNNTSSKLIDSTLDQIVNRVESLRARSLASRQFKMINEIFKANENIRHEMYLQPEKFIVVKNKKGKETILLPAVGVPHAFTYNQSEQIVRRIRQDDASTLYLIYDHVNIRDKWLDHLTWLDSYLPIKSKRVINAEKWLKEI